MVMNLELLKRFHSVAEEGTLGKASKKLNVASTALTKSIQDFEHELKTKLFDRVPKGMRLTPQGERLYAFSKNFLAQADSFEKAFHEKDDEISGEFKIATTPHFGSEWLIPRLKRFLIRHPHVKIKMILKQLKDISVEEVDIAICSAIPRAPHLIQKYLFTSNIRLFASQDYLKKFGIPQTVDDLDHHRLITYGGNVHNPYGNTSWVLNLGKELGELSRESFIEVDSLHGLISCARLGLGIIEAPDDPAVLSHGLIHVLPQERGPQFEAHYIYSNKRQNSKKIKIFFQYLNNTDTKQE